MCVCCLQLYLELYTPRKRPNLSDPFAIFWILNFTLQMTRVYLYRKKHFVIFVNSYTKNSLILHYVTAARLLWHKIITKHYSFDYKKIEYFRCITQIPQQQQKEQHKENESVKNIFFSESCSFFKKKHIKTDG